ncbi:MAG TPA: TonB family protein, partial [Myxococcota bacterium]|nr:TonB family protein [Myxococcota bacterium]
GGEALVRIDINAEGTVDTATLISATAPAFGDAALVAARQLVFEPALIDDSPAAVSIEYRYTFEPPPPPPKEAPRPPDTFSGRVREAGSRMPIAQAAITVDGARLAGTDADGRFSLALPAGDVHVKVEHPDYAPYEVQESLDANTRLEVKYYLVPKRRNPYESIVRGRQDRREASKVELSREELQKVPGTFGDPVRVIENLPGMGRAPAALGALLVRGANPADTQVLVDGMPIPLLYHFFALTSVINASFLERIDFYPGGFGARYGRATAGVVDIVTRDLRCDLWRALAKVDVVDAAAFTCTSVGDWQLGAAARRSYIDLWLPPLLESIPRGPDSGSLTVSPAYYDYQVKAHTQGVSHSDDIFLFGSNDALKFIQGGSLSATGISVGTRQAFHRIYFRDRWRLGERTTLTSTVSPAYQLNAFTVASSNPA